jgi:hypothetical protein
LPNPKYRQLLILHEPVNAPALFAIAEKESGNLCRTLENVIGQRYFVGWSNCAVH